MSLYSRTSGAGPAAAKMASSEDHPHSRFGSATLVADWGHVSASILLKRRLCDLGHRLSGALRSQPIVPKR